METPLPDPLLPAFYQLWKSAMSEHQKNASQDLNANNGKPTNHFSLYGRDSTKSSHPNARAHNLSSSPGIASSFESYFFDQHKDKLSKTSDEHVVVCTVECDQGNKFVKQIIHEGKNKSTWSRAEDVLVDWLSNELTSRHAEHQVDVTIYFCSIPMSTTSDGICLWVDNLRAEGKVVNVKIKVASLGNIIVRHQASSANGSISMRPRKGSFHENREILETEDIVRALRKMVKKGVNIEPISIGDWMQLMTLLTDRSSLQLLDIKRSPSADLLASILHTNKQHSTMDSQMTTVDDVFDA